jgi:hypothetical protein
MEETRSVNGISIRFSDERWRHIVDAHEELEDRCDDVLDVLQSPVWVTRGYRGSLVAWKGFGKRGFLAVIYKELDDDDGFVITAFFTRKPKKKGKVWPK